MKTIFKTLAALIGFSTVAFSQEAPQIGFIRIVNAISPGSGNASFLIDKKDLFKDGYNIGQTSGGYGVKSGSKNVEVRKEGVEPGTTKVELAVGETMTIIAFAERLPAKDPNDPPKWAVKLLKLKQQDVAEKGFGLSLVSVCKSDEMPVTLVLMSSGKQQTAYAKRLAIQKVDIGRLRGEVLVKRAETLLCTVSPDSPGNYVVILYEDAKGQVEALSYYDPKFVIAG